MENFRWKPDLPAGARAGRGRARWRAVAAVLGATLLLTACGGGSDDPDDAAPADPAGDENGDDDVSAPAADDVIEIRIASPVPESNQGGASLVWWKEQVEERSDGRVEVEIYPSGSFLAGTEILHGVGDGRVEMGLTFSVYHLAELPLYNMAGIPFVTGDGIAVTESFNDLYEDNELFRAEFAAQGVRPLFFAPDGSSPLGYTDQLRSVDDLDGLRLRVTGYVANTLEQVGVDSTFVEFAELYEALQRGTVQGWAGSGYPATIDLGLHEVTPYYHHLGIGVFSNIAVVMNEDFWNSLPADIQQIIEEVIDDYTPWIVENLSLIEANACDKLLDEGGEVVAWSDELVSEFQGIVGDSILDLIRGEAIAQGLSEQEFDEVLEAYLAAIERNEGQSGYQDGLALCGSA